MALRHGHVRRYKCKCCCYKDEIRKFVADCVKNKFKAEDVQMLCTYLKVPIEKPKEWTLLSSKEACMRPSVLWELDRLKIIEEFCQKPHKLDEILTKVLQRIDLAKKHQELLEKFHTVKRCLQHFQSNDNSPVTPDKSPTVPIQESAAHHTEEDCRLEMGPEEEHENHMPCLQEEVLTVETHTSQGKPETKSQSFRTPLAPIQHHSPMPQSLCLTNHGDFEWNCTHSRRTSSGASTISRSTSGASSIMYDRERNDSGISVASGMSSRKNTDDSMRSRRCSSLSLSLAGESVESIRDGFCKNCRKWFDNISPSGSQTSLPIDDNSTSLSSSTDLEDSQLCHSGSSGSSNPDLEVSIPTTSGAVKQLTIFGIMKVKRKDFIKHLKSSRNNWSHKSSLFPETKDLQGHSGQYRMRLHPCDSSETTNNQRCATISLDLYPVSRETEIQISKMTVFVSVYATSDKTANTGLNIANDKKIIGQETIRETTVISQFSKMIDLDLLERTEGKYIITEVNIIFT